MRPANERTESPSAAGLRVGVAVSRYHRAVTDALLGGAVAAFSAAGGREGDLVIIETPGAFELAVVAARLARRGDLDAVVTLGCIVRGETEHDRHIADAVAQGLIAIAIETERPVTFGVVTVLDEAQARARAGGDKGNKGTEAMDAALSAVQALRRAASTAREECPT